MSIDTRTQAIEDHITDDYSILTLAGSDFTNINKNLENLKPCWQERYLHFLNDGTDVVWDNWDKATGTGDEAVLDNTIEGDMKIGLKGDTTATNFTGKNIFDKNNVNYAMLSIYENPQAGTRITTSDTTCCIYVLTTPSSPSSVYTISGIPIEYDVAWLSAVPASGGGDTVRGWTYYGEIGNYHVTTDSSYPYIAIFFPYANFDEVIKTLQIEKNSQATDYETYGQATSLPTYPQNLRTVSGENKVRVSNKNLYNIQNMTRGKLTSVGRSGDMSVSVTKNDDSFSFSYTTNSSRGVNSGFIEVQQGSYVFNSDTVNSSYYLEVITFDENKNYVSIPTLTRNNNESKATFTVSSGVKYVVLNFTPPSKNTLVTITNPQLEKGTTPTEYERHKDIDYTINLNSTELCKISTYQDKIFKNTPNSTDYDSNLEDNVWYLKKEIGKVVLNGSESWESTSAYTGYYRFVVNDYLTASAKTNNGINNRFTQRTTQSHGDYEYLYILPDNMKTIYIQILQSRLSGSTANDFKTWLGTHNTEVYYILATPTYETITDTTLLGQLETLLTARSSDKQTNVTQIPNDLPFDLDVVALEDMI